ncbi:MAG: NADPH:quinone oxidoreductase family protein [Pseudomonadales bacterium]|nr:NADPH:quinone oxidoreductase family protein [Pseudomonadales bacterium]
MKIKTTLCHAISEDISSIQLEHVELTAPAANEVQIRIKACAVNFPDLLMIQGKYQFKPPLPFAPGGELAGDVVALGKNVTEFKIGDRVIANLRYGGFAEAINVPVNSVSMIPGDIAYEKAASYAVAYLTAFVALDVRAKLHAGETLLVHGATGGVGMAAVDLGKQMGAKVIATGGTDEKLAVVKSKGADHVINYTMEDGSMGGFREEVKALTGGKGADVIYDPVGGSVFDESMRCINFNGRLLVIGFTSGVWPNAPANLILIKNIAILGVRAGEIGRRNPEIGKYSRNAIYQLLKDGAIDPYVCAGFPLERAVDAMKMLEERKVVSKVVVTMNGYTIQTT